MKKGLWWKWQLMDGVITKAPLGGGTGLNPTNRGKNGTKRSLLTDGNGIPISITVDGTNRHDKKTCGRDNRNHNRETLSRRRRAEYVHGQGICLSGCQGIGEKYGCTAHIRSRGEEIKEKKEIPSYRVRK